MQEFNPQDAKYAKLVDRYARYIKSPVLRLKFLNSALRATPTRTLMMRLPVVGSLPERAMLIMELSKVLPPDEPAPMGIRITSLLYRMRLAVYAASLVAALAAGASIVYVATRIASSISIPTQAQSAATQQAAIEAGALPYKAVAEIGSEAGLSLDKVWLAEEGEGYEFYSNGARVLTEYETTGESRSYYSFPLDAAGQAAGEGETGSKPVGIVYHLSEGDLLPFAGDYNSKLQHHSKSLVEYAREKRLYNYVIDRFGRTYRIVRDEFASNHAGNSVWSDGRKLYVNLSASFIGVCFEGKSGAGTIIGPDGINEAQIYAARVLTAVLRSKHAIEDANCVTHGLVSVNPSNRLMGYHTDWVYGFPYEALGLSDKNQTELVAVSRLGFSYDQAYIAAAGGRKWPGLERADNAVKEVAQRNNAALEEERRAQWRLFQKLYSKQRALDRQKRLGGDAEAASALQ